MRPWRRGPGCSRGVPAENREKCIGKGLEKGWETAGKRGKAWEREERSERGKKGWETGKKR